MLLERRRHSRRDVAIPGIISLSGKPDVEVCRLTDLSAGGALVAIHQPDSLPESLTLIFNDPNNPLKVVVAEARVVRREKHHAGLEFTHTDHVMPWGVLN